MSNQTKVKFEPKEVKAKYHVISRLEKMQKSLGYNYIHSIDFNLAKILFGASQAPKDAKEKLRSFWNKMMKVNELVADGFGIYCLPNTKPASQAKRIELKNIVKDFWFINKDGVPTNARLACASGTGEKIAYFDGTNLRWIKTENCYRDYSMKTKIKPKDIILSTERTYFFKESHA